MTKTEQVQADNVPSERLTAETEAGVRELRVLSSELTQMQQQLSQQLTTAAVQDNVMLMMETKGMLRVIVMIGQNVEKRIGELLPTVGREQ